MEVHDHISRVQVSARRLTVMLVGNAAAGEMLAEWLRESPLLDVLPPQPDPETALARANQVRPDVVVFDFITPIVENQAGVLAFARLSSPPSLIVLAYEPDGQRRRAWLEAGVAAVYNQASELGEFRSRLVRCALARGAAV